MSSKTSNELSSVFELIQNGRTRSFAELGEKFNQTYSPSRRFIFAHAIALSLEHPDLFSVSEDRLNAVFLLYNLHHKQPATSNPFLVTFDAILKNQSSTAFNSCEKFFVAILFKGAPTSLLRQTAASYIKDFMSRSPKPAIQLPDLASLIEAQSSLVRQTASPMPTLFDHADAAANEQNWRDAKEPTTTVQETPKLLQSIGNMDDASWTPHGVIAPPPVMPISHNEAIWFVPREIHHKVMWDNTVTMSSSQELRALLQAGCQHALSMDLQSKFNDQIAADSQLVFHIGLTPPRLPGLVENNPLMAVEALKKLIASNQATEYLSALVGMELTLHCMEVVNKLATTVNLPQEFIQLYISNCVSTCETISDKYMQNRLVRLVCVFLQALIRNKIVDVEAIFIEVQAFCIEFSRIREAAMLFRLLKVHARQADGEDTTSGQRE